jgi:hypothetical protein
VGWSEERVQQLLADDSEPMQVVATIGPGEGSHGQYGAEAIQQLVRQVQADTLNGHLGHQDPATVGHAFPTVVVRWIGAHWDGARGVFRGLVDRHAAETKSWLRSGAIQAPSIFYAGPKVEHRGGQRVITGFERILGIDLAPLGRNGMPSAAIVYAGETQVASGVHEILGEVQPATAGLQVVERELGPWGDVAVPNRRDRGLAVRYIRPDVAPWQPPAGLRAVERVL